MATGTMLAFNQTTKLLGDGAVDFGGHTFKVVACSTLPVATNTLKSQLTASTNLVAATLTLASVTWATVDTNDAEFDAADVTFTASGGSSTIAGFAIFDENLTSPLDGVIFFGDVDTATASITLADGEKLKLVFNANGIARITT